MPDRSSGQELPEEWGRGSHARGPQFSAGSGGPANSHRVRKADGYGTGAAGSYRPVNGNTYAAPVRGDYGGDPLGARTAGTYGTGQADPFGTGQADPFGEAGAYRESGAFREAGTLREAGARREAGPFGESGPFGEAGSFGESGSF